MLRLTPAFATATLAAAALAIGVASAANAEAMKFKATLNGASEVPATTGTGTGVGSFDYDTTTKVLTWTITYAGLTGPAIAAHIHGYAEPGKNAPVVVPFERPASPITGSTTLTDAQADGLIAGTLYVNVHTAAHRPGEIRGQIVKQ
jgi:CHRD domain